MTKTCLNDHSVLITDVLHFVRFVRETVAASCYRNECVSQMYGKQTKTKHGAYLMRSRHRDRNKRNRCLQIKWKYK